MLRASNSLFRSGPSYTAAEFEAICRTTPPPRAMSSPPVANFEHEIGARIGRGDLAGAAAAAAACRAAWPMASAGWLLGSIAALLAEEGETALALIEDRLATVPGDGQCLLQKAECLLALGRRDAALASAASAAAHAGENAAALDAVGEFLVHAHESAQALAMYDRAVAAAPRSALLLGKRAELHRSLGNFEAAARDHEAVLALSPSDADALKGLAELRPQTPESNSIAAMEAALEGAPPRSAQAATLHFGLAKSFEDLGDHARSWGHLSAGNRLERARIAYDPATDRAVIERIIAGFPALEPVRPDTSGERPIFIVGLPRTGTTLVERIIGRHSQVHSAGELNALSEAIGVTVKRSSPQSRGWLGYAAALGGLDGEPIAREYLAHSRAHRGVRPRFSDKNPANFFYCALILRAFPRAHIVHLTRSPLAACYAIYRTRFEGAFPFSYDLAELADFYVGYRRLMTHWHRVLPNRILDVAYEEVVTALEPTTRRLFDYLDLPFEEACLDFELNPDPTLTASAVQVRQPLYDSSLDQWRHYAAELAPVRSRLEAAGISVDPPPR
jgi:tetratricopeptide (TPR) repeat protein